MSAAQPVDAQRLPELLARAHAALAEQREAIDDLNVFPVPDGDTGTNMTLTMRAALDALEATSDPAEAAQAVVRGALRGARGNSGVILSQVVRAVVEVTERAGSLDAQRYADALADARRLAYEAVNDPVEGTILTVITAAAEAASEAVSQHPEDLVAVSSATCDAVARAVLATTDQLEALRDAGVVDAGARGFEVLLGSVHAHLTGEPAPELSDATPRRRPHRPSCEQELTHRFEVQYLLDGDDAGAPQLRRKLEVLGDSVVVVASGGLLNVHVHTDDIGAAIEVGLEFGRPSEIEVTHFGDQLEARRASRSYAVGAVAVLDGQLIGTLGDQPGLVVVPGHAGRLPPVADLLNALGEVRAERVVLLPGHPNAVPTAHQTVAVAVAEGGRPLDVLDEADSPCAVLAALSLLDPEGPADEVLEMMRAAASALRSGEVVTAVRDATTPVGDVREGQPLAVVDGRVVAAAEDSLAALEIVCEHLGAAGAERVMLLLGASAPAEECARAGQWLREHAAGEVEVLEAGHRPAHYSVGVE